MSVASPVRTNLTRRALPRNRSASPNAGSSEAQLARTSRVTSTYSSTTASGPPILQWVSNAKASCDRQTTRSGSPDGRDDATSRRSTVLSVRSRSRPRMPNRVSRAIPRGNRTADAIGCSADSSAARPAATASSRSASAAVHSKRWFSSVIRLNRCACRSTSPPHVDGGSTRGYPQVRQAGIRGSQSGVGDHRRVERTEFRGRQSRIAVFLKPAEHRWWHHTGEGFGKRGEQFRTDLDIRPDTARRQGAMPQPVQHSEFSKHLGRQAGTDGGHDQPSGVRHGLGCGDLVGFVCFQATSDAFQERNADSSPSPPTTVR